MRFSSVLRIAALSMLSLICVMHTITHMIRPSQPFHYEHGFTCLPTASCPLGSYKMTIPAAINATSPPATAATAPATPARLKTNQRSPTTFDTTYRGRARYLSITPNGRHRTPTLAVQTATDVPNGLPGQHGALNRCSKDSS